MSEDAFDLSVYPPTYIGPTWMRSEDGEFIVPERTLGWEVAGWCADYLLGPEGGPWMFTFEQLRFVLWWFAVDEDGRFVYREGALQRLKGWGKDPLGAVLSLVELCGPSRFSHFDDDGSPVGKPHPSAWVEIYGVSKDSTRNTTAMLPTLMSDRFRHAYGIEDGKEIVRANQGRCRLMAMSGGYRSAEGGRTTFMLLGETQHWTAANGGHNLYDTVVNNVTKTGSRYLAITNAYLPGEDSVAERMRTAWEEVHEGRAVDTGLLYDSIEAHEKTPLTPEALREVLPVIRGDATWLNVDDIIARVLNRTTPPARSRRMWLNQIVSSDESLVTEGEFNDALLDDRLRPGDPIVLGFDGGNVQDATALVAIRVTDGLAQPMMICEKPLDVDDWEVDREFVDETVRSVFDVYDVQAMYCDVRLWEAHISQWAKDFGHKVLVQSQGRNAFAWDMRGNALKRLTGANELTVRMIRDGYISFATTKLTPTFRRHVLNVRRRENTYGVGFGKETRNSPKKIDAYAALVAATAAWDAVRQSGKERKARGKQMYFI